MYPSKIKNKLLSSDNRLINLLKVSVIASSLVVSGVANAGWEVRWIDAFNDTSVDWSSWTAQTQANYNNEIQCYTDDETSINKNYDVSDGTLKIIARKQNIDCPGLNNESRTWTSGRLNSKDKAEFLYGRVEARIRFLDLQGGTWPAFWMLENRIAEQPIKGDNDTVNWPNPGAGEIDVWEWFSNNGNSYITNFFNANGCGGEFRPTYPNGNVDVTEFHTYALEWDKDNISFFMDDDVVVSYDVSACPQYEEPMFVLLNVAIGGNLGGAVDSQLSKATMEVDYVAHCVASSNNNETRCNESTPFILDDDNDGVGNSIDLCPNTPANVTVDANGCEVVQLPNMPEQAAPSPVVPSNNVISLFSDEYANIDQINLNPNWGQSTQVTEIQIDGNNTLKYSGLNYQGTDYDANHQDVSNMDVLHLDYWSVDANEINLYLISPGPIETPYALPINKGQWQSVDIPLTAFTPVDLTDTFQLKMTGNGTVYLDNVYFAIASEQQDSDNDGVVDDGDDCPNTAQGIVVDELGCELNYAPELSLTAYQNGQQVTTINTQNGTVTIEAVVVDKNEQDQHVMYWDTDGDVPWSRTGNILRFEPGNLTSRNITFIATVQDDGRNQLTDDERITLNVTLPSQEEDDNGSSGGAMMYLLSLILLGLGRRKF